MIENCFGVAAYSVEPGYTTSRRAGEKATFCRKSLRRVVFMLITLKSKSGGACFYAVKNHCLAECDEEISKIETGKSQVDKGWLRTTRRREWTRLDYSRKVSGFTRSVKRMQPVAISPGCLARSSNPDPAESVGRGGCHKSRKHSNHRDEV